MKLPLPKKIVIDTTLQERTLASEVSKYFLAKKLQVSVAPFISKGEKEKNFYIANNYFRKVFSGELDYDIPDEKQRKEYFDSLKVISFWKEVIDYLFDNTDDRMISFYGQTFNGVVLFLEKRYYFCKNVKGKAEIEKEQQEFLKQIKKWKLEEFNDLYLCLIAKIYKKYKPYETGYKNKYYIYSQHIIDEQKSIKIKTEFFEHSDMFRAVFSHYLPEYKIILQKLKRSVNDFIDLERFEKLCESRGTAQINLNKVDINELIEKAAREYYSKTLL